MLAMAPHAGYVYSGRIAGATYACLEVPERILLLGPNHTGLGKARSLWPGSAWRTPLGDVSIDRQLCQCLRRYARLDEEREAHRYEHAIEVQLPFLQKLQKRLSIAALCLGRLSLDECIELGDQLARALADVSGPVLIVCSTDMSHYISAGEAQRLDDLALAQALAMDPEGLYRTVVQHRISMCGFVPTTVGLALARGLGAQAARLVDYGNSGETSGDFERVVGYAGLVVS